MARGRQQAPAAAGTRHDAEVVAGWLDRRRKSGWTWAELERRSSIPRSTLQWWKRRLEDSAALPTRATGPSPTSFVEVSLDPDAGNRPGQCLVEFRSGHRVVIEAGFPAELLRVLAETLARG